MGKTKKDKWKDLLEIERSMINRVINVYLFLSLVIFPLLVTPLRVREEKNGIKTVLGGYLTIFRDKYFFYCVITLTTLVIAGVLLMIFRFVKWKEFRNAFSKRGDLCGLVKDDGAGTCLNWKNHIPELAAALFLLVAAISTFTSPYVYESFWGNEARQCGLFLFTLYVGVYFLISRYWEPDSNKMRWFLVSAVIASLFGMIQYLGYDLFDFRRVERPQNFISTFGNINTYTAFIGVMLGAAAALYIGEEKRQKTIFCYVSVVISIAAIITGNSDNAYLTLGALFGLLPFYAWKTRNGFKRYLILVLTFLSEIKLIAIVNDNLPDSAFPIDSLFVNIASYSGLTYLLIVFWIFILVINIEKCRFHDKKHAEEIMPRWTRKIWGIVLAVIILIVGLILYDINIKGNTEPYRNYLNYLKFDDDWGTHRGFIWRSSWQLYERLPLWQKLFGHGPDTLGILFKYSEFKDIAIERYNEIIESAHNEYLHYLVTSGLLGLLSYVCLLLGSWYRMIRKGFHQPFVMACLFGTLCYCVQAAVNISAPIVTPIVWVLLAMGLAGCREKGQVEK